MTPVRRSACCDSLAWASRSFLIASSNRAAAASSSLVISTSRSASETTVNFKGSRLRPAFGPVKTFVSVATRLASSA